jgi:integrase
MHRCKEYNRGVDPDFSKIQNFEAEGRVRPTEESNTLDVDELGAIAPEALARRLRALAADFKVAYSPNTLRTCGSDWRVWRTFCEENDYLVMPATVDSLRAFLLARLDAGRKRSTLDKYLATLRLVHRLMQTPWPLETMEGRLMLKAIRKDKRIPIGDRRQAKGLTREALQEVLAPLKDTDLRDVRDAALLSVAYETMCRRSELVALQIAQIQRQPNGTGRVLIERSKTDQEGEGATLYLTRATMDRVDRWRELAGLRTGALFRSIPHIPKQSREAVEFGAERFPSPLSGGDVARIFKRRWRAAGLKNAEEISGHSTRVGPTQDLLAKNFSLAAIMKQGRWNTERMVVRYGKNQDAERSAMAQMLEDKEPER